MFNAASIFYKYYFYFTGITVKIITSKCPLQVIFDYF